MSSFEVRAARPRVVFFRWMLGELAPFIQNHVQQQQSALEQYFDVTIIDSACDYDEICDRVQPDLAIFESGGYAGPRSVTNTDTHPEIPKLGFLHTDAFDTYRAAYLSDMDRWGIEWTFTTSMSMPEYLPEVADKLFVWPNFVEGGVIRDYGLPKRTEVLLTGSRASNYPWRNAVSKALAGAFRNVVMPHHGWHDTAGTRAMPLGEAYARQLNSSYVIPTCGSFARDVVRKHLEIPGSMACLVTEQTATVEAFGFRDMINCVFADERTAVDRVRYLFDNPDELLRITRAGYELVHTYHTAGQRDQPAQWLQLVKEQGTAIDIVQDWPDGRLRLARAPEERGRHLMAHGIDRELISGAWDLQHDGRLAEAESALRTALDFYFIPEAAVALAHVLLRRGDVRSAQEQIRRILIETLGHRQSHAPDPVVWAYEVRGLLCRGDVAGAMAALDCFPELRHAELDRVKLAVSAAAGLHITESPTKDPQRTVAPRPPADFSTWVDELTDALRHSAGGRFAVQVLGLKEATHATMPLLQLTERSLVLALARRRVAARLSNWRGSRKRGIVMTKLRLVLSTVVRPARTWLRSRRSKSDSR